MGSRIGCRHRHPDVFEALRGQTWQDWAALIGGGLAVALMLGLCVVGGV